MLIKIKMGHHHGWNGVVLGLTKVLDVMLHKSLECNRLVIRCERHCESIFHCSTVRVGPHFKSIRSTHIQSMCLKKRHIESHWLAPLDMSALFIKELGSLQGLKSLLRRFEISISLTSANQFCIDPELR
jgi:hypothetical protein